ncbi:glycine cleavage system P-family protein, partial [Vibrio parahaemolyticus V-223/04]
ENARSVHKSTRSRHQPTRLTWQTRH